MLNYKKIWHGIKPTHNWIKSTLHKRWSFPINLKLESLHIKAYSSNYKQIWYGIKPTHSWINSTLHKRWSFPINLKLESSHKKAYSSNWLTSNVVSTKIFLVQIPMPNYWIIKNRKKKKKKPGSSHTLHAYLEYLFYFYFFNVISFNA